MCGKDESYITPQTLYAVCITRVSRCIKIVKLMTFCSFVYNLIFFMFIRFSANLLVKTIDSYLHEFCARGILHSAFQ